MPVAKKHNIPAWIQGTLLVAVSLFLTIYNIVRIRNISITHDETGYKPEETYAEILQSSYRSANNHILHSVFRKFFVETFANNLFFMRLDSLLAQIAFFICSWLLCRRFFTGRLWQTLAFILLQVCSPLLFQFWGLSRGYALAITLMLISLYYLLVYLEARRTRHLGFCLAAAILTVFTNFGLINYYLALCTAILAHFLLFTFPYRRKQFLEMLVSGIIAALLLALLIYRPLVNVYSHGELSFLGTTGFVADTLTSLVKWGLFIPDEKLPTMVHVVLGIVLLQAVYWLIVLASALVRKQPVPYTGQAAFVLFLVMLLPACSMIAQHRLYGINYLIDRTALFFIPLFTLQFIFWLYSLKSQQPLFAWGLMAVVCLVAAQNFVQSLNTRSAKLWWYDADDRAVLHRIVQESGDKGAKIRLRVNWFFVPSFRFYLEREYANRFEPIHDIRDMPGKDTTFDFYYIASSELGQMPQIYYRDTDFVGGGFVLFRKRAADGTRK